MKIFQKPFIRVIAGFLFFVILTFGIRISRSGSTEAPDYSCSSNSSALANVVLEIPIGATGSQVADILFNGGVTKSSLVYFRLAVSDENSKKVAPGAHRLNQRICAKDALKQLLDPDLIPNLIKITEGAWQSEIRSSLITSGFKAIDVDSAFTQVKLPKGFSKAEGLLFPAQYSFSTEVSALEAIQSMIDRFSRDSAAKALLTSSGKYSPAQLLIIASLIQAEGDTKDFPKISRVIRNRLEISMPLQLDSTVHYIKKVRGQIFLSTDSTLIKSPFNTYKHYGLPPSPIGNPGSKAIDAALNPVDGDWLFFITVAPGDTRFTRSNDEFLKWKIVYEKNRKAGAFK